jgi:hypothetical protein
MKNMVVKLHKDYSQEEFGYDRIERAWQAISGLNSGGRYFFIAHLEKPLVGGEWMSFLRRPDKKENNYLNVPFNYEGFNDLSDADQAIYVRAYKNLGWRINEIEISALPTENPPYI